MGSGWIFVFTLRKDLSFFKIIVLEVYNFKLIHNMLHLINILHDTYEIEKL